MKDDAKRPRAKRQTKAEQRERMLDQMLDAAEYLFSERGFYGVTLKDVSERVGVHTSLPHYYFENKKSLFDAVVERRLPHSMSTRMEAMDRYEKDAGDKITVEGALRAFLDTELDNYGKGGEGWRNYGALGAQVSNSPEWGAEVMDRFNPVVLRLIELLKKALPECPEETLFWGYHFVTGALMLTIGRTGRIDVLSGGLCKSEDFETIKKHMATFMAAGFMAICHR